MTAVVGHAALEKGPSGGTAGWLAPDAALPHRDELLTVDGVRRMLDRLPRTSPRPTFERIERVKAKYRLGESVRALHRLHRGGAAQLVAARMVSRDYGSLVASALATAAPSAWPGVAGDEETGTVLWTLPADRKLDVTSLLQPDAAIYRRAFAGTQVTPELVSHTPERAAIARLVDARTGLVLGFGKVYADDTAGHAATLLAALDTAQATRRDRVTMPRVLGVDRGARTIVVDAVPGEPLAMLSHVHLRVAFRELGVALARLHALPVPPLPSFQRFESRRLGTAAQLLARARPDVASLANRSSHVLARTAPSAADFVCLHGDVNSRNWLVRLDEATGCRRVGLIDLDQAAVGPAAADLGAVLAYLRYRTRTRAGGADDRAGERALAQSLLDGYGSVRALPDARTLAWYAGAASLVERALRSVTRVRPEGLAVLPGILEDALGWAEEAGDA